MRGWTPLVSWDFCDATERLLEAVYQPFPMQPHHRAQVWRHHPAYWRPRHFHREPELNVVFAGQARMAVGARIIEMAAGDAVVLRPGQDHALVQASSDLDLFVLALTPEVADRCLRHPIPSGSPQLRFATEQLQQLRGELSDLATSCDPLRHETRLCELFARAVGRLSPGHPVARKALHEVVRHPGVVASSLSRTLNVHPSELSRHVQRDLGLGLVEYRSRVRLMRFIALVDEGRSMTHACVEAEFGSYQQCHRTFVRHLGCSPRRYFAVERHHIDALVHRP